jgi:hypothetical protein
LKTINIFVKMIMFTVFGEIWMDAAMVIWANDDMPGHSSDLKLEHT